MYDKGNFSSTGMCMVWHDFICFVNFTFSSNVLVPFRDLGHMTLRQRLFNYTHSSIRMFVERSFGVLRSKMRRLLKLYIRRFDILIDHLVASFVLHNFMILGGREAASVLLLPGTSNHLQM